MNTEMIVLSKRSQTKKSTHHMISFTLNYAKCKPIYGDRKQIGGCWGREGQEEDITKGQKDTFGVTLFDTLT